jgi:DNA-binding CsgD family transcriptional regulator
MTTASPTRALDKIARLSGTAPDLVSLWREASGVISEVVSYYSNPCWYTLDPASLLITSHFNEDIVEFPREWLANEYYGEDVNKLADIARSDGGISTLHEVTNGDPASSPRWQENIKLGGDQELVARLQTRSGEVWGALGLYRAIGSPMFDAADKAFVTAITPVLAAGARRALLLAEAKEPDSPDSPGLVVLTDTWEVESSTPGVECWLSALPDGDWDKGRLPSAVVAVAARALKAANFPESGEVAVSRVRARNGTWVVLHGVTLVSNQRPRAAVIVEPAHPARIVPLLMAAFGLTDREQEVTRLVLQGASTNEMAGELVLSTHTIQQHLKNIFDKTGVRSRRDLIGKVFFSHYEPRLRDNEQRASSARPLRGGPMPKRGADADRPGPAT